MSKIGIVYDKSLYLLLKNFLDEELIFIGDILKLDTIAIDIVILDQNLENLFDLIEKLKVSQRKIILCGLKANYKLIKKLEKRELIDGFFEKDDHLELENILEILKQEKISGNNRVLIKSDKSRYYHISPSDINYIVYDRISRKSLILTKYEEIKSKRKMQELEDLFCSEKNFIRADRGCIVNIDNVAAVDLENCNMYLKNGDKVFQSASALKEILKNIELRKEVIKI
jgi:DNA-binding LytR/AlgR family response regulator